MCDILQMQISKQIMSTSWFHFSPVHIISVSVLCVRRSGIIVHTINCDLHFWLSWLHQSYLGTNVALALIGQDPHLLPFLPFALSQPWWWSVVCRALDTASKARPPTHSLAFTSGSYPLSNTSEAVHALHTGPLFLPSRPSRRGAHN